MTAEAGLTRLVLRAQAGEAEPGERLLATLTPTARVQCGPVVDGENVAQETLLLVHQNLAALEHPEALSSWLWMLTRTACSRLRRRSTPQTDDSQEWGEQIAAPKSSSSSKNAPVPFAPQ